MLKRGRQSIGVFLIYLIVITILYTPIVMGQFFADVHGTDNVPGFRRISQDLTIINITAKSDVTPGELSSSRFVRLDNPATRFECKYNNVSLYTECEASFPEEKEPGEATYEVQLFNPDMTTPTFSKRIVKLYFDGSAPDIPYFNVGVRDGKVKAQYQVTDSLCPTCPQNTCSGIKKVQILSNMEVVGEQEFNTEKCAVQNETEISNPIVGQAASKKLCIRAYDRLGQMNERCDNFILDFSPPELINASLWTPTGKLEYYNGKPIGNAHLELYFKEETVINTSSMVADLSGLNSREEFKDVYQKITPTDNVAMARFQPGCTNGSKGIWKCTINNLLIYLPPGNDHPVIKFEIEDTSKGKFSQEITLPVIFDASPPIIKAIRTNLADPFGRYWISPNTNNTIYVDIDETGAGMNKRNLYLDFSALGNQPQFQGQEQNIKVLKANNCTEGWTCTYGNIEVNKEETNIPTGDVVRINVMPESTDDSGNPVTGLRYGTFYYDDQAPQIISYSKPKVCPVFGDTVNIELNVTEPLSGGVKVTFDASEASTRAYPQEGTCEQNEDKTWTCKIQFDQLITIAADTNINITLTDLAGNSNTTTIPLTVCQSNEGIPPNLISCDDEPESLMPEKIDRKIATQIAEPLFIKPKCRTAGPDTEVQDVTLTGCSLVEGGTVSDAYIFDDTDMLNPTIGTSVALDQSWLGGEENSTDESDLQDKATITCNLEYRVKSGKTLYKKPENETITYDLDLENLPLGYIDDAVGDELDDLKGEIKDIQEDIDQMKKANWFFGIICTIATMAVVIMQALIILKEAVWVAALIINWEGKAGDKMFHPIGCKLVGYLMYIITFYIWNPPGYYVTMPTPGTIFRFVCSFYTCKLADSKKFIKIFPMFSTTKGATSGTYTYAWAGDKPDYDWKYEGKTEIGIDKEGNLNINKDEKTGISKDHSTFYPESEYKKHIGKSAKKGLNYRSPYLSEIPVADMFSGYHFDPWRSMNTAWATLCVPMMIYNTEKLKQITCMKYRCVEDRAKAGFDTDVCDYQYTVRKCLYYDGAAYELIGQNAQKQILWKAIISAFMADLQVALVAWGTKATCRAIYGEPKAVKRHKAMGYVAGAMLLLLLPAAGIFMFRHPVYEKVQAAPFFDGPMDIGSGTAKNMGCGEGGSVYGTWSAGIGCDVMMAVLFGMDLGEWALWKSSWDFKKYFKKLEGKDYCEGIE